MKQVWAAILVYHVLLRGVTVSAEECADEGSLRLVGWETVGAGRVEICHSREWGTICADGLDTPWSEKNAQVACRVLGYSGALNSILHSTMPYNLQVTDGSRPIHYSQVRCTGEQDSLLDCELTQSTTGCTHQRDAAIVCRPNVRDGHVRLVGDARDEVGAVELFHPLTGWTGICADPDHAPSWLRDNQAAEIVCRQLGYQGGRAYVERLPYSAIASRDVTIDECNVDEDFALTQCSTSVLTSNCSTDALAWVQCTLGNKEYGNAKREGSNREGVMQLEFNGRMGHICDTGWDSVDAEVACVEFNLDDARTNYDTNPEGNYSKYISDLMPIWITDVRCTNTEKSDGDGGTYTEVNENDVIDCEISTSYPVGFTDCHTHNSRDRIALVDCGSPWDAGRIAAIVLGVLSPFIFFGIFFTVLFCIFCCKSMCKSIWHGIRDCCQNACGAVSRCFSRCGRFFSPHRILRLNSWSGPTSRVHTTTTGSSDVELTPAVIFDEPKDEPEPQTKELTEAAPPSYNDATTYTTAQDKTIPSPPLPEYSFQPPPPSTPPSADTVVIPLQLPAPEPVD